jgi:hypothetical protein
MSRQEEAGIEPLGEIFFLTFLFIGLVRICMVRRTTAREKLRREIVCANVFVNKGEGVVNGRNILIAP